MEDKQIGIITFHDSDNYGAVLQAYALQHYIETNISKKVEIIDYRAKASNSSSFVFVRPTHNLIKDIVLNLIRFINTPKLKRIHSKFDDFRKDYLHLSSNKYVGESIFEDLEQKDVYITGSDQVFNPRQSDYRAYYLDFNKRGGKKVAYAPSFGISVFADEVSKKIRLLLEDFDALSCREQTGASYLSKLMGRQIETTIDPVFLLSKEEWSKVAIIPQQKKYILVYCLSASKRRKLHSLAKEIAKKENLEVVTIGSIGPQEFVGHFMCADFVLTDSFHGTSFSLIFGKRHLSYIANKIKGTRIVSVMDLFGKKDEIIYDIDNYRYNPDLINVPQIYPVEEIQKSKNYLIKNIG